MHAENTSDPRNPNDNDDTDEDSDSQAAVQDAIPDIKEPPKYAVVVHNDDFTTMEFVVDILTRFFGKSHDDAMRIMLKIHQEGRGIAGVFTREIAEMKIIQVTEYSKTSGHPLRLTAEPVL
jgi:ATP-dependent Clp protease adaptor protein ClpS